MNLPLLLTDTSKELRDKMWVRDVSGQSSVTDFENVRFEEKEFKKANFRLNIKKKSHKGQNTE